MREMMRRMMWAQGTPPAVTPAPTATPGDDVGISYQRDVQPIFSRSCVACHGGSAGLWLDSYDRTMAGGANGPVVAPGRPEVSELYWRVTGERQPEMPLGRPSLSPNEIEFIRIWIAADAPNN